MALRQIPGQRYDRFFPMTIIFVLVINCLRTFRGYQHSGSNRNYGYSGGGGGGYSTTSGNRSQSSDGNAHNSPHEDNDVNYNHRGGGGGGGNIRNIEVPDHVFKSSYGSSPTGGGGG